MYIRFHIRRNLRNLVVVFLALITIGLCLAAPFVANIASKGAIPWTDLAVVGEAYGGVAAVVSAFALTGIAISLLLQWRQTRLLQIFSTRERHFELVKLGIEHPHLLGNDRTLGTMGFANLWVAYWAMEWDVGTMSEAYLRRAVSELFTLIPGATQWWLQSGPTWASRSSRSRMRFVRIVTEECERLTAAASQGDTDSGTLEQQEL